MAVDRYGRRHVAVYVKIISGVYSRADYHKYICRNVHQFDLLRVRYMNSFPSNPSRLLYTFFAVHNMYITTYEYYYYYY